jgi:hypothetical protein
MLYLFYNADLVETCKTKNTEAVGYSTYPRSGVR